MSEPRVARIWRGRTRESVSEEGVKKLRATEGNLGVQAQYLLEWPR